MRGPQQFGVASPDVPDPCALYQFLNQAVYVTARNPERVSVNTQSVLVIDPSVQTKVNAIVNAN